MRSQLLTVCLSLAGVLQHSQFSRAEHSLYIESKEVSINATACTVGVYLTNSLDISGITVALEARSSTGGAYLGGAISGSSFSWGLNPTGRAYNSPLGPAGPNWPAPMSTTKVFADPSGSCSNPNGAGLPGHYTDVSLLPNDVSPDGFLFLSVSNGNEQVGDTETLVAGTDVIGHPSLRFIFPVNGNPGTFTIDGCCIYQVHLSSYANIDFEIYLEITPGVITILPCKCDCPGDPACDGVRSNILDVVAVVDAAFNASLSISDPNAGCPYRTTDVNCSGSTDVLDVVKTVNVAFRGANATTEYCEACL